MLAYQELYKKALQDYKDAYTKTIARISRFLKEKYNIDVFLENIAKMSSCFRKR